MKRIEREIRKEKRKRNKYMQNVSKQLGGEKARERGKNNEIG